MVYSHIKEILSDFVSLFFPKYCLGCLGSLVKGEQLICTLCLLEMPQTNHHLDDTNALKLRLEGRIQVRNVFALFKFSKSGRVQQLLHQLKYKNHPELGEALGRLYASKLQASLSQHTIYDIIIPVPLHPIRKRKRGYNQSAMFAQGLSSVLSVPFSDAIIERKTRTETQTKKSRLKRWENVEHIFYVKYPERIIDKNVLLVDDVITTGATLEACADSLLKAGCKSISIACIAEA